MHGPTVVDSLEMVDIQVEKGHKVIVSARKSDQLGKAVLKEVTVGEIRQGIEMSPMDDLVQKNPSSFKVPEDDHASPYLASVVPDQGRRMLDDIFDAGAMTKDRVVRPSLRVSFAKAYFRGAFFLIACEFVLEAEHRGYRLVGRFRKRPAGQILRHHIHVLHPASGIRDDDGFSKGTQNIREKPQGFFLFLFPRDLPKSPSL